MQIICGLVQTNVTINGNLEGKLVCGKIEQSTCRILFSLVFVQLPSEKIVKALCSCKLQIVMLGYEMNTQ